MEKDYSILRIHLVDSVPAYEFSKLTSLVNDIYDTFLWVEDFRRNDIEPLTFHPNEENRLYITKADIGTPNVLEFMGLAEHLINTTDFLAENYNKLLTVGIATLITIEKTNSIIDFIKKVNSVIDTTSPENDREDKVKISRNKSLQEELMNLKTTRKLNRELLEEKNHLMNYVRNIRQISENIIISTNITIIKSE